MDIVVAVLPSLVRAIVDVAVKQAAKDAAAPPEEGQPPAEQPSSPSSTQPQERLASPYALQASRYRAPAPASGADYLGDVGRSIILHSPLAVRVAGSGDDSPQSEACAFDWGALHPDAGNVLDGVDVVKCLLVGDKGVGKTVLAKSMLGDAFTNSYTATVFETYKCRIPLYREVPCELWDVSGDEKYDKKRPVAYQSVNAALVCFDISDASSWENVKRKWLPELQSNPSMALFVVACKFDVLTDVTEADELLRMTTLMQDVHRHMAACTAWKCARYFETSARTGAGLEELFRAMVYSVLYDPKARLKQAL